jgi:hypothetical protein
MMDLPTIGTLPPAQQHALLSAYYVPSNIDALFADPERSVVALAYAGCGLTTGLSLLPRYRLLSFPYNPDQWPARSGEIPDAGLHRHQWMRLIAARFLEQLRNEPARVQALTSSDHEYLLWLVRRYMGHRPGALWLTDLRQHIAMETWQPLSDAANRGALDQMYGEQVSDLYGQIDEALQVAARLGWQGIYASIDISWADWTSRTSAERNTLLDEVRRILMELTPLQRLRFGVKMGIPRQIVTPQEVKDWVRGRAHVASYEWPLADLHRIATSRLKQSAGESERTTAPIIETLWQRLSADIDSIWEVPVPATAVTLARIAQANAAHDLGLIPEDSLRRQLYEQAAFLRLDPDRNQRRVWRGMAPIELDDTQYRFFEVLWKYRGNYADNQSLMAVAGNSAQNLDKILQRLREAIEPFYKTKDQRDKKEKEKRFLYIERTSNGTRLIKDLCLFS